jgi:hypothetical protein
VADVDIYLELSDKRVFACSYAWPGWTRSGKSDDAALQALVDYAPRYAPVPAAAGIEFESALHLRVLERLPGDATTAFGAPSRIPDADMEEPSDAQKEHLLSLLGACWEVFDQVAAASLESLRKGPRGGGRDRTKIVDHVLAAEAGYSRLLGLKLTEPKASQAEAIAANRRALLDGLRQADATRRRDQGRKRWPMSYATRRLAWHVLDHAWEIEDRRSPDQEILSAVIGS